MAEKISIHKRNVEARLKSLKDWKTAEENKEDIVKFLHDLEMGKVNRGRKISIGRQLKYLDLLKVPFVFWKKAISELELKDIENFEKAISSDQILSYKNKPFSHESKRDIKIALKIYLKWKLGDSRTAELVGWLDTRRITKNPDTWGNEPPILGDLLNSLRKMEKRATRLEQSTINSLANRLDMYVHGVFEFFNKQTNIDFDNKFVCFDIGNMPSQVKPAIMFLVLDYIYMKMKSDLSRKILLIDESWSLLSRTEEAGYIFEIVKTSRKFNLGLILINQEVEGLLDSKAGKSVLANSSYTMLMRQKPAVIDNICRTFHLSDNERNHILTANTGEGLLIMEDDHTEIKVIASPEEHKLITTNADEIIKQNNFTNKKKKVNIGVDEHKRFFRKNDLSKDERKYLLSKKYQEFKKKSLLKNKEEEFFLLPRHNETANHLFYTYAISEYLEKKGIEVKKYVTRKPDLVFNIGKKKYAIEIETGAGLAVKSRMKEKLKVLSKYDEWFFVVTDKNKVANYKKYGKSFDLRYLRGQLDKIIKTKKSQSA